MDLEAMHSCDSPVFIKIYLVFHNRGILHQAIHHLGPRYIHQKSIISIGYPEHVKTFDRTLILY